jgi:superfamily II DNA or RNA helicase
MLNQPPERPRLVFSGGTLLLTGVSRATISREPDFPRLGGTWDSRELAWRCDALWYQKLTALLDRLAIAVEDAVTEFSEVVWPCNQLHPLRAEQTRAVEAWSAAGSGLIVMPTGTGKTEIALAIMARTAVSTLVVAPVRDLMYQWHRRILSSLGYDAGVIGDSVFRVKPVSVTTYDSAYLHMERLGNQFGLVIFDECHHLPGPLRRDAARMSAARYRLGLTATPERSDGCHVDLAWLIGPTVYELPLSAVAGTSLAEYDVVRIPVYLSADEQARYNQYSDVVRRYVHQRRRENAQFTWKDVCAETRKTPAARAAMKAYRARQAIEDRAEEKLRVLEDLFRLHAGEPCLVFTGSNAMAREVSRRFLIPCLLSHCGKKERLDVLQGLSDGSYPALVANQVLDEGVDLPEVKVAIVIGGTSSSRQAKQRLGRILRRRGNLRARLYEIVCADTKDEQRSRSRRRSDAYKRTRHRRNPPPETI